MGKGFGDDYGKRRDFECLCIWKLEEGMKNAESINSRISI